MQTTLINTTIPCYPANLEKMRKNIITQAIDVLGRDGAHDLFHNHKGRKALHRYPLIQYRVHNHKLSLFAVGEAVPALLKVVTEADLDNRAHLMTLNNVTIQKTKAEIKPSNRDEYYRLMDWIAFNNETFNDKWNKTFTLIERVGLLNNAISGHLKILGKQLLSTEEATSMDGELYMLTHRKTQLLYGNKVMGFNVIFRTKFHLPEFFALGRGVSLGAGTFQKLRNNPEGGLIGREKKFFKKSNEIIIRQYSNENQNQKMSIL